MRMPGILSAVAEVLFCRDARLLRAQEKTRRGTGFPSDADNRSEGGDHYQICA